MTDFACVLLVDSRGWVLLQERDEHAPIAPERWAASGGHVEPGESFLEAAVRELHEETGLVLAPEELQLVGVYDIHHVERASDDRMALYAASTTATDADIVLGEGRRIVFVDPEQILDLPLSDSARAVLPGFLASELYATLRS
ncbi:NUDIX domain-containing protein [Nocardioides sp. BP30]|uniref:NUDIX domain-containing protein n=1 Tax=Nocardioides sp. BP30 TaxID=3036374 RepID=UPI00246983B9|nr:NUDIX domain-containing protein [Nocardioides sp. BP30]WGL50325.1 NUDIX domain-containing protein [Nocardioides sp. BP30]